MMRSVAMVILRLEHYNNIATIIVGWSDVPVNRRVQQLNKLQKILVHDETSLHKMLIRRIEFTMNCKDISERHSVKRICTIDYERLRCRRDVFRPFWNAFQYWLGIIAIPTFP